MRGAASSLIPSFLPLSKDGKGIKRADDTLNWKPLETSCGLQDLMEKMFSFPTLFCYQLAFQVCPPHKPGLYAAACLQACGKQVSLVCGQANCISMGIRTAGILPQGEWLGSMAQLGVFIALLELQQHRGDEVRAEQALPSTAAWPKRFQRRRVSKKSQGWQ